MTPTTALAIRVAALCKRKPTTPWSPSEIRVFKRLVKSGFFKNLDDLALIEQYYAFERQRLKKTGEGFHRRKLSTFLNWAASELDAANDWREEHPLKPPARKIIPMPLVPSEPPAPLSPEDEARRDAFWAQYQQHKTTSAFQKVKRTMEK